MEKMLALALLVTSIAVLAYLALTLLPQAVAPRVAYVKVEKEGGGRVLVNGSRALSLRCASQLLCALRPCRSLGGGSRSGW